MNSIVCGYVDVIADDNIKQVSQNHKSTIYIEIQSERKIQYIVIIRN